MTEEGHISYYMQVGGKQAKVMLLVVVDHELLPKEEGALLGQQ